MLKKITSLILAGAIAVSLTACSSSKEEVPVEKEEIKRCFPSLNEKLNDK